MFPRKLYIKTKGGPGVFTQTRPGCLRGWCRRQSLGLKGSGKRAGWVTQDNKAKMAAGIPPCVHDMHEPIEKGAQPLPGLTMKNWRLGEGQ